MFIAVMDETGFVQFASVLNVSHRARVSLKEAEKAVACLEAPDEHSSDPDNEGRRVERVPGGWIVLNAEKYRDIATRQTMRESNKARVQKYRAKESISNAHVMGGNACNASSPVCNEPSHFVMQSETETETDALSSARVLPLPTTKTTTPPLVTALIDDSLSLRAGLLVQRYGELFQIHRKGAKYRQRPNLDWSEALTLLPLWDDARLEKLAILVLTTDDAFISSTDRGFKIFAMKASWADDRLTEWEEKRACQNHC